MSEQYDLISIIVPVYNVKNYLEQCLNSLANQTYKNIEVLLVNDGSTDGSDKICEKYSLKDSRFKNLINPILVQLMQEIWASKTHMENILHLLTRTTMWIMDSSLNYIPFCKNIRPIFLLLATLCFMKTQIFVAVSHMIGLVLFPQKLFCLLS